MSSTDGHSASHCGMSCGCCGPVCVVVRLQLQLHGIVRSDVFVTVLVSGLPSARQDSPNSDCTNIARQGATLVVLLISTMACHRCRGHGVSAPVRAAAA